jgi:hypothetical protein
MIMNVSWIISIVVLWEMASNFLKHFLADNYEHKLLFFCEKNNSCGGIVFWEMAQVTVKIVAPNTLVLVGFYQSTNLNLTKPKLF